MEKAEKLGVKCTGWGGIGRGRGGTALTRRGCGGFEIIVHCCVACCCSVADEVRVVTGEGERGDTGVVVVVGGTGLAQWGLGAIGG